MYIRSNKHLSPYCTYVVFYCCVVFLLLVKVYVLLRERWVLLNLHSVVTHIPKYVGTGFYSMFLLEVNLNSHRCFYTLYVCVMLAARNVPEKWGARL